jgi:cell division protein ZapA
MNQLEVQIMGQSYLLVCPEDSELRLREAVSRVDAAMCNIRDLGKIKARDRIAVLAALNLTFELLEPLYPKTIAVEPEPEPEPAPPEPPEETATSNPQLESLLQRLDTVLGKHSQPG